MILNVNDYLEGLIFCFRYIFFSLLLIVEYMQGKICPRWQKREKDVELILNTYIDMLEIIGIVFFIIKRR